VWLAATKVSVQESERVKRASGMSGVALVRSREHNAMYQFVMRSSLRDYDSTGPVTVYAFSRTQAEYLHERLGGEMKQITGVVTERTRKKGGRPKKEGGAMTPAERKRRQRARLMSRKPP
jgi:hypothetical protein